MKSLSLFSIAIIFTLCSSSFAAGKISLKKIEGDWDCDGAVSFSVSDSRISTQGVYDGFEISSSHFKGLGNDISAFCVNAEGLSCEGIKHLPEEGELMIVTPESHTPSSLLNEEELNIKVWLIGIRNPISLTCRKLL